MKWLAFYYIFFFILLYVARNWVLSVIEEDRADSFNLLAKLGWYVLQAQIFISFGSYVFILFFAISNHFFGFDEESRSSDLMFYFSAIVFALPFAVIGKIIYEQGYKRGLKGSKDE